VLAPIIAGFLFEAGVTLPTVSILMGLGSTLAAGILLLLKLSPDQPGTPQPAPASSAQVL
jgi:hypothetical protein